MDSKPHTVRTIALPVDLGEQSLQLYAHGLKLALQSKAELHLLNIVGSEGEATDWLKLPSVRNLLNRWGILSSGATYADYKDLGVRVHIRTGVANETISEAIVRDVQAISPDLLILGTQGRGGIDRLRNTSVSEPVVRQTHRATLFINDQASGFVDVDGGELLLQNVLVPISNAEQQQPVIDELQRLLTGFGVGPVRFTLLHVGRRRTLPSFALPSRGDWAWRTDLREGNVVEQILAAADAQEANLVAMATRGHDSVLDALRGSTMERVLRQSSCALLAVPV